MAPRLSKEQLERWFKDCFGPMKFPEIKSEPNPEIEKHVKELHDRGMAEASALFMRTTVYDPSEVKEYKGFWAEIKDNLRKGFEAIERNEYDEIMNAQEDADEAKYGEQPKREPMLSDDHMNIMFASYGIGFAQYGDKVREYYENLITRGKLLTRETHNAVIQDAFDAAAEVDAAGGDAPHAPAFGLGPWIRMRFGFEKKP